MNKNNAQTLKLLLSGLTVFIVLSAFLTPAYAATGDLFAVGITSPAGMVKMGTSVWVSDHAAGFCRLDPDPLVHIPAINLETCVNAESATGGPISPGQPAFDATANNIVYVPDNAATIARNSGVWRLTFNPATQTISAAVLIANISQLGGANKPTAAALDQNGNLLIGFISSGNIAKIINPAGVSVVNTTFGRTSDGGGTAAIAFAGADLYLAEAAAVTRIGPSGGTADAFSQNLTGLVPTAIASSGADTLFIANTPVADSTILRYTISNNALDFFAFNGNLSGRLTRFDFATGLFVDTPGNLFIGDDPTEGILIGEGRIWQIPAGALPEVAPPAPAALTQGSLYAFGTTAVRQGITSPAGMVWMGGQLGGHLWVSDHFVGFCRVDQSTNPHLTFTLFTINQTTCVNAEAATGGPVSPGQPSFDALNNFVYVPDNAAVVGDASGVWRLAFNPTTEIIASATVIADIAALGNAIKPTSTSLGPDGRLYVGFIRSGLIKRIANPHTAAAVEAFGNTSDGFGVSSMAFAGSDLYLTEGTAVTKIVPAGGKAQATLITANIPTAITSFGTDTLFIAETPAINSNVLRYRISTNTQEIFANTGLLPPGVAITPLFQFVSGLTIDPQGRLFIADDPSEGIQIIQGRIWNVSLGAALPPPAQNGNITGTVTRTAGTPIAGATVTAGGISVTTNATGRYTISIAAGTYTVTANAAGFNTSSVNVTVTARATVTRNFVLTSLPPGTITGTVTNASSAQPIAGATVTAGGITAATDAAGRYSISIAAGTYTVAAGASGFVTNTTGATVAPGALVTLNFALRQIVPNGTITGTVSSAATGAAIAGAAVTAGGITAITNVNGVYTISLVPDTYIVTVSAPGFSGTVSVAVTSGAVIAQNFALQPIVAPLNGILNGTVTNAASGEAVAGATVTAGSVTGSTAVITNADGIYSMSIERGTYTVTASAAGFTNTTVVRIDPAAIVTHNFALQPAVSLNGTITGAVTNITSGAAISGATVTAGGMTAITNANGTYSISILPGVYTAAVRIAGFNASSVSVTVATTGTVAVQNFTLQASSLPAGVADYDANGDGIIQKTEAVRAVLDFFSGVIQKTQAVAVVIAFFTG